MVRASNESRPGDMITVGAVSPFSLGNEEAFKEWAGELGQR